MLVKFTSVKEVVPSASGGLTRSHESVQRERSPEQELERKCKRHGKVTKRGLFSGGKLGPKRQPSTSAWTLCKNGGAQSGTHFVFETEFRKSPTSRIQIIATSLPQTATRIDWDTRTLHSRPVMMGLPQDSHMADAWNMHKGAEQMHSLISSPGPQQGQGSRRLLSPAPRMASPQASQHPSLMHHQQQQQQQPGLVALPSGGPSAGPAASSGGGIASENDKVYLLVAELCNPDTREAALLELSKKREQFDDLALVLWHAFGKSHLPRHISMCEAYV